MKYLLLITGHKWEILRWAGKKAQLPPSPSKYGTHRRNDWVLPMFSAGHLLDSLGELPASLTNIPGSVANTLDWAGKALFLFKDRVLPATPTVVGDVTVQRNFSLLWIFFLSHYHPPVYSLRHTGVWYELCWQKHKSGLGYFGKSLSSRVALNSMEKKVSICCRQNGAVFS